ncbi:hypothetical protein nbrc107696_09780 [Gordonia spumicola]|uniref:DUF6777 domain-containing protein n=1 Tax=Gordonia spumicola TaxID=589161 RepID=A0A7I9V5R0_9ACTN|nr:DUF6777 domain-containing protein [Gordonia spumicola]GEE00532.1 hypothetical protein nbrc107696_09780 [Gordonia spumicola]
MTYPPSYPFPQQPGFNGAAAAAYDAQRRSRRRMTVILSAIVAILSVVLAIGAIKVYQDKTGNIIIPALSLRNADDPGPDPFTPSVSLARNTTPMQNHARGVGYQGVRAVNGTDPGLYGTTGTSSCDTAALGNYLNSNPGAAAAWASVFGIRTSDIPWYLNTLTPVVLTADTWVTNHAYRGGVAEPFQSVLQAGTPVYVDSLGVPRAVCSCGNPLRPPSSAPIGGFRVKGDPWRGFEPKNTYKITYNTQNTTVVNNTTTVVNAPAGTPAPLSQITLQNIVSQVLETVTVGKTLDLPDPPADVQLPDPASLNVAPTFAKGAAADNGLQENSDKPADNVVEQASENKDAPVMEAESSETDAPSATDTVAPGETSPTDPAVSPGTTVPGVPSDTATSTPETSSTTTTTPTSFSSSGDAIGSLTFSSGGASVTCTLPSSFDSSTVTATCSDSVSREFNASDLEQSGVSSALSSSSDQVWRITAVGSSESLAVSSASWQTLTPETTSSEETTTSSEETTEPGE